MVKKQLTERARDFHIVIDDVAIVSAMLLLECAFDCDSSKTD